MKRVVLFLLVLTSMSANTFAGTKTWNNASGGNWNDAASWTPNGTPGLTDTVYITLDGTYTVTYNLNFSSVAAIYLGAPSGTQTLRNPGNVNGVTGSLTIGANGVFQMTSGTYSSSSVINYGTVRLIGGSFTFAPKIVNYDSVYISGTTVNISGGLTNYDSVFVASGTFNLSGTDTAYAGKYLVSSGATLNFNAGTHTLDANSTISGAGNVTFNTTVNMSGVYNISGTTVNSAGTTTFNGSPGSLISIGDSLHMSGGTLNLLTGDSIIVPKIRMNSATTVLLVNAPVRFTASFTHNAGTIRGTGGSGIIIVSPGLVYDIPTTTTTKWQKLTVFNEGTIQWSGSFSITLDSGVVINNYGLFNPLSTGTVTLNYGVGAMAQFNNYGTYRRSVGTTVSNINALFNGYSGSLVEVQTGTLAFNQNSTFTDADASVSSGALLSINDTSSWDAASSISGAGNVDFSSLVTMSGSYNIGGYTSATGGTTTFNGTSGSLISIGDSLYMASATLRLFTGDSVIVGAVRLNSASAVLSFNNSLRFTRSFTHNSGTLNGLDPSVAVIVSPGLTYNASTSTTTRWRRLTLQNYGTVQWSGSFSITLDSGVVINNYGLFNPQSTGTVTLNWTAGTMAQFNNFGTYRRSVGTTASNINALFNGFTGSVVEVQTGTLAFNQNSAFADADASVSSGALLQFNDTSSWDAASSISGAGNVDLSSVVTFSGNYSITGTTLNTGGSSVFNGGVSSMGTLDSLNISSGTLTFNTADTVRINRLQLSNGTLTGSSPVKINTVWNWSAGTRSGSDSTVTTVIIPGANLNISSASAKTHSRHTILNYGTMAHTGSAFTHSNGALFDNQPSGVINLAGSNSGFAYGSGFKPRLKNSGLIKKSAGTASTIAVVLDNTNGRIEVQTNSLTLSDTSKQINSTDTVFAGATLIFSGGTATKHTFDSGSRLAGYGNVTFSNGTATLSGTYDILGVTTFTGDTVLLNGADGSLQSLGDSVSITGGTVTISTPDSIQLRTMRQAGGTFNANMGEMLDVDTLTLTGGTLTGNSPIRVTDYFTWSGGTHSATDSTVTTTIVDSARFTTGTKTLVKRTLINKKYIQWTGGHWDNNTGAIIRNEAGAVLDVQAANFWFNYFGAAPAPLFVNYGTLRQSSGTLQSNIGVPSVHNNAVIDLQSGTFNFAANATYTNTDIGVSNGRTLVFSNGTQTLDSLSTLTGTGIVRFTAGTYTINGLYNISDSTEISAAVTFNGTVPSLGSRLGIGANATFNNKDSLVVSRLTISGGTSTFNMGDSILVDTLRQIGGIIAGDAPIRVKKLYDWSTGYLYGSNPSIVLINNGTMNVTTNTKQVQNRTIINENLVTWSGAHWDWDFGAVFINQPGALINITGDWWWNNYPNSGSDPFIYNYGTIRKSAGTGTSVINISRYDSNATIEVQSGTLAIGSTATHTMVYVNSDMTLSNHARLRFSGSTQTLDTATSISGSGVVDFNAGTITVYGSLTPDDSVTFTGGTAYLMGPDSLIVPALTIDNGTLSGDRPIRIYSKFVFNSGTLAGLDSNVAMVVGPNAIFTANGLNYFSKRTIDNYSTFNWIGGEWRITNGAIFINRPGATMLTNAPAYFNYNGGSPPRVENYGTIRKASGATTAISLITNSYSGSRVEIKASTLQFANSWNATGTTISIDSGTTWQPDGGTQIYDSTCSIEGKGNIFNPTFSGATIHINGYVNLTGGTMTVNDCNYYLEGPTGRLISLPKRITVGNGDVYFNTPDTVRLKYLRASSGLGNIGGVSHIITDTLDLAGGNLISPDTTSSITIPNNGMMYWAGGQIERRKVFNYGNANWSNPESFSTSSKFINMHSGNIQLTADARSNWHWPTSEPYLINYGSIHKSSGSGTGAGSIFEYQISNYGTIRIDSGLTITCEDSLVNFNSGIITGKGTLDVSTRFNNSGTIRPGTSPGRLRIIGNLRNTNSAVYHAEIDTAAFPNRYDQLRVSGSAALGGTLNVNLLNGYLPALNDSVKIMTYGSKTGTFSTINGLRTGGPYDFVPLYKDTALYLVASDSLNILPIANNDVITVSEDVTTNLPVLSNDVDSNGDGLSIVEILPGYPQHGTANIGSPDTTIVYTSALNYFGTDTLRYVIYDGRGGWDTASVRINVAAVNDRPVAKDTTASTNQFGVARVNVVATATDIENSPLVVSTVTKPKYGDAQVDATDTAVVYIPPVNFTGIDSFKFYVSDGNLTDSATVVVNVTAGDSFLVTWSNFNQSDEGWGNINDVSDSAWLATGGNPGGRFYAVDAVSGQWWYFTAPSKFLGDLSSSYDKTFRYDIKQNPNGLDNSQPDVILIGNNGVQLNYNFPSNPRTNFTSFGLVFNETAGWKKQAGGLAPSKTEMQNILADVEALRIRGEFAGGSDSASIDNVILGKIPGNNSPIANADDASTNEEVSVQITPLTNDTDPESQSISISAVGNAPNGKAVIDIGNLSITYKPDSNFAGVDSFAYYITDGYGGQDSAYIRVTVNNINDAPYVARAISDTAFAEDFGKKFIAELDSVFRDVDNGPTFGATNLSAGVTPFISGDTLYVLSSAYFNGSVTIALSANDGQYTAVDTFMVTVSGVNNAPMLTAALRDTSFNEDFGTVFLAAMDSHFADVEGDSLVYSIEHLSGGIVAQILRDTLWLNSVSNFNTGPVFIRVEASDGSQSVSDTFSVFVTPVNDPVYLAVAISDMTLTEGFAKTFAARLDDHFGDLDGVKPVFTAAVLDSGVSTLISGDTLYVNSVAGFLGQATVRVVASDTLTTMADTFKVTVNPFNFSPVLSAAFRDTIFDEDFGRVFVTQTSGYFSDPDDATLTYSANILGGGASVQMQNDSLYVTSSLNFNGPTDIRVAASDGFNSVSDTFRITVQPVNDAPVMTASLADKTLLEDFGSYFVTRLSQVYNDPDYDSLAFSAANLDAGVDAIISGDSLYLHSTSGFLGQVRVRTAADDGQYAIADTFMVTVNPSNFPPTLADALRDTSFSEDFGKVFVRSLSGAFADADDTSLTYGTASLSAGLTSLVSNDSLYLNSGLDFNGTVNVRVYASDGVSTVSDTLSVTVTPVNDAPVRARVMADQTLLQDFGKVFGDRLSAVFSDIDNGSLTYTVTTLNAGVNGVISNDTLYLLSTTGFTGASTLRVTAGDGEFTAADTFVVNVNSSNTPPQILAALRDTTFAEDFGKVLVYKLGSTFTDADPLTFAAAALNAGLTVSVSNDSLYLTSQTNFNGTVSVRVTAADGAFTVPDTFIVTVSPVNDAPSSFTLIAPASGSVINVLRPVFRWNASRDIDGDALQYTLEISAQSNFSTLAQSYALADTVQTLTSDLDSAGTYYWRVTAADGHGGSVQTPALSFRTDAARPNLRISVLQGTVAKRYLDAYAYSNEDLSGAVNSVFTLKNNSGAVIDSRPAAMNRIGTSNLYSSSYHVTAEGNLEIQVTAQDLAGNQRVATRSYAVSALLKGQTFVSLASDYELTLSRPANSESGFIVVGSLKETESPTMPSLHAGVELMGTTELRDAMKLTIRYDETFLALYPDFDERKIGIYRATESGFEYVGGQGRDHAVTVSIQSFGKYVVLYDESRTVIPDRIELAQNYPNPFNPTTTIRFGLVSGGKVKLVIYNVLGQRVRELVNDERAAGFHKVIWDGRNAAGQTVASGLYIYRLETPDGVLSRKMTFLK